MLKLLTNLLKYINMKKTTQKELIRFYFNQYWSFNNPEMLRQGELTKALERTYSIYWKSIPNTYDNFERLNMTNKLYDNYLNLKPKKINKRLKK